MALPSAQIRRAPDFTRGTRVLPKMMRRLGIVRLDAFQLHRLHRSGLALDFLLQAFHQLALLDDDVVELLHLMFQVRDVGFELFKTLGNFVGHKIEAT